MAPYAINPGSRFHFSSASSSASAPFSVPATTSALRSLPYVSSWAFSSENILALACESRIECFGFCSAAFGLPGATSLSSSNHKPLSVPSAITSNWNDLAGGGLSEKIYQRLLELAGLTAGWNGSGSLGMNASSLWSFIAFWKQIRQFSAEPELVLTPSGHVQAEWSKNNKHYLEIDFRSSNGENSYFALIDGRKAVIEGAASIKEILSIITSYQNGVALTWQYEQEK